MDIAHLNARRLVSALHDGGLSSRDLTAYFLERIHSRNNGAVVYVDRDQALRRAAEIDRRRARGEPVGRLQGLPFTIKDAFRVAGQRTTWGLLPYKWHKPRTNSGVIDVLLREDGIVIGRTAVPTASFDWTCRNQVHPECTNPLDPSRTPGGSSGGAAAALALGLTPVELGSDLGGSIRYPAHCCGVTGIRTTDGWLPVNDTGPANSKFPFSCMVVPGPMGRTLDDLEFMLEIYEQAYPLPETQRKTGELKIAYSRWIGDVEPEPAAAAAFESYLRGLPGIRLEEARPDFDAAGLFRDWCTIVGYEYARILPAAAISTPLMKLALDWLIFRQVGHGFLRDHFRHGMSATRAEYERALESRREAHLRADRFFGEYDAWISPVSPAPALKLEKCGGTCGRFDYSYYLGMYLCPTAMLGTPAVSFPVGMAEGMPVGVQVHGARFTDLQLVRKCMTLGGSSPRSAV